MTLSDNDPGARRARVWGVEEDAILRGHHEAGATLTGTAKAMGWSGAAVSRHAARLGLTWDRGKIATALAVRQVDLKAQRAQLKADLLSDARRLREQLWQPVPYVAHGGKDFERRDWTEELPTIPDRLKLVQAAQTAIGGYERLEKLDEGTDAAIARSLVGALGAALGLNDNVEGGEA